MNDRVTVAEAEDRLRRTLARRAGDVPPADGPVTLRDRPPELTLVPPPVRTRLAPGRRLLVAAAATAACILAAAAVGIGLARGRESTELVPAQEPPTTDTPTTLDPGDLGLIPLALHRTPGTIEFAITSPPGWERRDFSLGQ